MVALVAVGTALFTPIRHRFILTWPVLLEQLGPLGHFHLKLGRANLRLLLDHLHLHWGPSIGVA